MIRWWRGVRIVSAVGTGALLLSGGSAVYAVGASGPASVPLDLAADGSSVGSRWQGSDHVIRFPVRLEGPGADARLAIVTTPADALRSIECPDASGSRVPLPDGLQVCRVGDLGQEKSVDVLLNVPEGTQDIGVTAVTRMRGPGGEWMTRKAQGTIRAATVGAESEVSTGEEARPALPGSAPGLVEPTPGAAPRHVGPLDASNDSGTFGTAGQVPGAIDAPGASDGDGAFGTGEMAPEISGAEAVDVLRASEASAGGSGAPEDAAAVDREKAAMAALVKILDTSFAPAKRLAPAGSTVAEGQMPMAPAEAVAPKDGVAQAPVTPSGEAAEAPVTSQAQAAPPDARVEAGQGFPQMEKGMVPGLPVPVPEAGQGAPQAEKGVPVPGLSMAPAPEGAAAGQPVPQVPGGLGGVAPGTAPDQKSRMPRSAGQDGSGAAKVRSASSLRKPGMAGGAAKGAAAGPRMAGPQMPGLQMAGPQMPGLQMPGPQMAGPPVVGPQQAAVPPMLPMAPGGQGMPGGPGMPLGPGMSAGPGMPPMLNGSTPQMPPAMPSPASIMSQPLGASADSQLQGAPLPRDVDGPNTEIAPAAAESSSLLSGVRGLPAVGIAMAALLGLLWLQMRVRRRRGARPVL
ncbi:hypothetical protein [Streptosporangium sp. 'caverna']|uniref:hypothetical protein n=1 Tax=Streptosporangium sp. 'caverna' TaxID=2202249 RepID=UPI000D7D8ACB|nr:hypothetical protein [Streptosporangium sp. 'caverna']AWS46739.1 hypothetical protein DKM19_41005 [Streptosporangium sp. 'caverna']